MKPAVACDPHSFGTPFRELHEPGRWVFSAKFRHGFVVSTNLRNTCWSFYRGNVSLRKISAILRKTSNTENNYQILAREISQAEHEDVVIHIEVSERQRGGSKIEARVGMCTCWEFICMCVYIYIYMYVCVHYYMYMLRNAYVVSLSYMDACVYLYTCIHVYKYISTCMCIYIYIYTHIV